MSALSLALTWRLNDTEKAADMSALSLPWRLRGRMILRLLMSALTLALTWRPRGRKILRLLQTLPLWFPTRSTGLATLRGFDSLISETNSRHLKSSRKDAIKQEQKFFPDTYTKIRNLIRIPRDWHRQEELHFNSLRARINYTVHSSSKFYVVCIAQAVSRLENLGLSSHFSPLTTSLCKLKRQALICL